jgi:hypothetical protein
MPASCSSPMGPKNDAGAPLSRAQIIRGMTNKHLRLLED